MIPRLEKRPSPTLPVKLGVSLFSVVGALVLTSILFLLLGFNPLTVYTRLVTGALGSTSGWGRTITKTIPLILVSAGLAVAFRARLWNIGAPGQMAMGSIAGTWVGLFLFPEIPSYLLLPGMFLAGFVAGALYAAICAVLNHWINFDLVISTLLLNYVAFKFLGYLLYGPWQAGGLGFPYTQSFPDNATLPVIPGTNIHYPTLLLGLVVVGVLYLGMEYTGLGFEIRVFGENRRAVRYAGMNELKIILLVMVISGGLSGLAGVGEVAGLHQMLKRGVTGAGGVYAASYGYVGIFIAWLGRNNVMGSTVASFFIAVLLVGGQGLQLMGISYAAVSVLMGLMLMFLMAGEFFMHYRLRWRS